MSFSSCKRQGMGARPQSRSILAKENSATFEIIFRWKPLLVHCLAWALVRKRSTGEMGYFLWYQLSCLWYQLSCDQGFVICRKVKVLKAINGGMFYAKQWRPLTKREVGIANSHYVI